MSTVVTATRSEAGERRSGAERRRYCRFEMSLPAQVHRVSEPGGQPISACVANLGPAGAFLQASELVAIQTHIVVSFALDPSVKMSVLAKVLWRREIEGERGMGCSFVNPSESVRNLIHSYMLRHHTVEA